MCRSKFYRSCRNDREPLITARVWNNPPENGFVKSRLLAATLIKPLKLSLTLYTFYNRILAKKGNVLAAIVWPIYKYKYLPDEQYPLRNLSFKITDGSSNHNFTNQVVYLHPRPPTFSWFCQYATICALSPQILMTTVIMLILKQLYPRELQITWPYEYYMAHARKWYVTYWLTKSVEFTKVFFLHTLEVYINVTRRHKTSPPSNPIMVILCDQKWQPSK